MRWIAFFSQTGNEINSLSRLLGRYPDLIVTNKPDLSNVNQFLPKDIILHIPDKSQSDIYESILKPDDLITLHGYLRIIPKDICEKYNIYNSHPGLISKYPILKGKDPQKKAFDLKLKTSGVVIHKVIPEVDSGEILLKKEIYIFENSLDQIYSKLHECSVNLWYEFLNKNKRED